MKLTYLEYFIPDEYIIQLIRFFIRAILTITVASSMLYLLLWLCSMLILFIHGFTSVCHALYEAMGSSPYIDIGIFYILIVSGMMYCIRFYLQMRRRK